MTNDIAELATAISHLAPSDRIKIEPSFQKICESSRQRKHILELVQESLSQLRLDMNYLIFDITATRKERDDYRDMLRIHPEDAIKPLDDRL